MSVKEVTQNKEKIYNIASISLNFFLSIGTLIFLVYLFAPLFGGQLLINALILYGSWIGMAILLKFMVKRARKGLQIKQNEYIFLCTYSLVCIFLWFSYPINTFISLLTIIGIVIAYKKKKGGRSEKESS